MYNFKTNNIMNNLERKLIELTFPTVNVDSLMEIIVATPNTTVATEILCGIYVEPVFIQDKLTSEGTARTFMSYDKWTEQINYSYLQEQTVYCYFPETVDKATITADNYKSLECDYGMSRSYRYGVKTGKLEERTDWCSVRDWNRLKDNNFELSGAELEATL
jgi:hypothetical protein